MRFLLSILFISVVASVSSSLYAQSPEAFNYQAVVRDTDGEILSNTYMDVRVSIRRETVEGPSVYTETHSSQTNEYGLLNIQVGTGFVTAGSFSAIEWWKYAHFLKVEIDLNETGFTHIGTQQLLSVPYALNARHAWSISGNEGTQDYYGFIGTTDSSPLRFKTNNWDRMIISELGNIGIGTSYPEAELHVASTNGPKIRLTEYDQGYTQNGFQLRQESGYTYFENEEFGAFVFQVDGGTSLITSGAGTGIGEFFPEAKLHVSGGSDVSPSGGGFFIMGSTDGINVAMDNNEIMARSNGSTAALFINGNGGGVVISQTTNPGYGLTVNGTTAKPGGGSWTALSDVRMKKDVNLYQDGLEELLKVNPVTFHYNESSGYDMSVMHIGVIAQEIQQISPYMVSEGRMDIEDPDSPEFLAVDPSAFTYMLINSVKEQQGMIEQMKMEIEALQMEIKSMKAD